MLKLRFDYYHYVPILYVRFSVGLSLQSLGMDLQNLTDKSGGKIMQLNLHDRET